MRRLSEASAGDWPASKVVQGSTQHSGGITSVQAQAAPSSSSGGCVPTAGVGPTTCHQRCLPAAAQDKGCFKTAPHAGICTQPLTQVTPGPVKVKQGLSQ